MDESKNIFKIFFKQFLKLKWRKYGLGGNLIFLKMM